MQNKRKRNIERIKRISLNDCACFVWCKASCIECTKYMCSSFEWFGAWADNGSFLDYILSLFSSLIPSFACHIQKYKLITAYA